MKQLRRNTPARNDRHAIRIPEWDTIALSSFYLAVRMIFSRTKKIMVQKDYNIAKNNIELIDPQMEEKDKSL